MRDEKYVLVKREYISFELRKEIIRRDKYSCRYCGSKKQPFCIDHVYPVSKGGQTTKENLVTSCLRCNAEKYDSVGVFPKPIGYFETKKEVSSLNVSILVFGIFLVANGFMGILKDVSFSRESLFAGILVLMIFLARFVKGK